MLQVQNFDSKAPCKTLRCALPHVLQCSVQIDLYAFEHVISVYFNCYEEQ